MRHFQGLGQDTALVRPPPEAMLPATVAPTVKEIPYDYVATFTIEGVIGNRVQDVINISTEGAFVAAAIGYSFLPLRTPDPPPTPGAAAERKRDMTGKMRHAAGIAMGLADPDPKVQKQPIELTHLALLRALAPRDEDRHRFGDVLECILARLCGIDFLYSIIDSGSGRELQNQPIHNIAGLGKADGDRPFRPLAKPMLFMPRSTIRIEIIEQSGGDFYAGARLFFVLHGYKILGYGTALP